MLLSFSYYNNYGDLCWKVPTSNMKYKNLGRGGGEGEEV